MKRALVLAIVLSLTGALLVSPVGAKSGNRKKPAATKKAAGPGRVGCPSGARRVKVGDNLQAKIRSAGNKGVLCFKRGTYRLRGPLRPRAKQTLIFERGAVLSGARIVKEWRKEGSHWAAGGQTQRFEVPGWMREHMCKDRPAACIYEDVFLDGKPLRHVTSRTQLGPGRVYFDKSANRIFIATNPNGRVVEATVTGTAIESAASGVTIRGAGIEKFAHAGIHINKHNRWTVSHSDIRHMHLHGIGAYNGKGHVVRNNRVHHNGVVGMSAVEMDNFTVRDNEFSHNNYLKAGPSYGHHDGAIKILKSRKVAVRNNWSHHNYGDGLWFDWDNHDILIANNLLEKNTRHGLFYEASFDATVRHNTIRNNGTVWEQQGAGIFNSTSKNVRYLGNRISNNAIRSIVIQWERRGRHEKLGERQSANLLFRGNVIALHKNFQSWVGVYWDQDPRVYTSNNRFIRNRYVTPKKTDREGKRFWRWHGKDLTWKEWRSHGFDAKGSVHRAGKTPVGRGKSKGKKKKGPPKKGPPKKGPPKKGPPKKDPLVKKLVPSQSRLFLRDSDGCAGNENFLSATPGPNQGCRDFDQDPIQSWAAREGTPFTLDASRSITGEVITTGGRCTVDAHCSPAGLGAGVAQLDIVVMGKVGGKEIQIGRWTEEILAVPDTRHTSPVRIELNRELAEAKVTELKFVTRLHGAAVGYRTIVLDDSASFLQLPTFVYREV